MANGRTMLDAIDHLCICPKSVVVNEHPRPEFWECSDCGGGISSEYKLRLTKATAEKLGALKEDGSILCPNCNHPMEHQGPQHFAELHMDICVDETIHTAERYRNREISAEDYQKWFNSLTEREKLGQYERSPKHHVMLRLDAAELELEKSDPARFQEIIHDKLLARLELDAHYILQHRYTMKQRKAAHLVQHFHKKSKDDRIQRPS